MAVDGEWTRRVDGACREFRNGRMLEHIRAIFVSTRLVGEKGKGKRTHHETVRYGTRDMDRLHLLWKSANERIDQVDCKTLRCARAVRAGL
jgi:hypothetical protein